MDTIELDNWHRFSTTINDLISEPVKTIKGAPLGYVSPYLFRGQSNHSWGLSSTLERFISRSISVSEYYSAIRRAKPQIESFTGQDWLIPEPPDFNEWLAKQTTLANMPGYEYMVYLRHHGFPSPLLDWTRSPFIAAFFAFIDASNDCERVAIFAYRECIGRTKSWSRGSPHIQTFGPYIKGHRRHHLQQSEYTLCAVQGKDEWTLASHQDAAGDKNSDQDIVLKITIPVAERVSALKELDAFNLNTYSLFGNEEGLMQTVALREFKF